MLPSIPKVVGISKGNNTWESIHEWNPGTNWRMTTKTRGPSILPPGVTKSKSADHEAAVAIRTAWKQALTITPILYVGSGLITCAHHEKITTPQKRLSTGSCLGVLEQGNLDQKVFYEAFWDLDNRASRKFVKLTLRCSSGSQAWRKRRLLALEDPWSRTGLRGPAIRCVRADGSE